jgi:hypothetical protein
LSEGTAVQVTDIVVMYRLLIATFVGARPAVVRVLPTVLKFATPL